MSLKTSVIVLLGPPGAGKGSQARRLAEVSMQPLLSIGDTLRQIAQHNTEIGGKIRRLLASGALMDNEIIADVIRARTANADCTNGYIIDGYPRNLSQAQWFDHWTYHQAHPIAAIYISLPKPLVHERVLGRQNCTTCGELFNVYTHPAKVTGACDRCGSTLIQRKDDVMETLERRYQVFESETFPLLEYYKTSHRLISVDGRGSSESVFHNLRVALHL